MGTSIKFIHFADLHIGVESYGRIDPDTGLSTRLGDFLAAFDELVDFALGNDVDLVVFSGDAYKSRDPSQTHQREFARRIRRLIEADIPVFLLVGNHDMPHAPVRATALEIFPTLSVPKVFIGSRPDIHVIQTRKGPVQILALPWATRSSLLAKQETQNLGLKEINQLLEGRLTAWLHLAAQRLDPDIPAVLSAHASLANAKLSSERTMMVGRDYILMQSSLAHPSIDYVAMGHVHRQQVLSRNPPIAYSGSMQRVDFGEEDEEKGFYVVELDPSLPRGRRCSKFDFHQVKARRFLTIGCDIKEGDPNPTATVIRAIERHHVVEAVVRVQIDVPASLEAALRMDEIGQALSSAHHIASLTKEVQRTPRVRLSITAPEALSPAEALKLYVESKGTSPERAKKLMDYAARLMAESGPKE